LLLFEAHSLETAFLAADDGLEETYRPCSFESITTVKLRFVVEEEEDFFFGAFGAFSVFGFPPICGIYIIYTEKFR
jgi:hypothetical protein